MNGLGREHGRAPWRTVGATEPERYTRRGRDCDDGETGRGRGVFRHNRGLLITLIDLIVVSMLFVIFLVVIRPLSDRVTVGAYQAEVSVEVSNGDVYIRSTVQHRSSLFGSDALTDDSPIQPIVTITALGRDVADLVPPTGSRRTIELRIPEVDVDDRDQLAVTIRIGDEEAVHTVPLR